MLWMPLAIYFSCPLLNGQAMKPYKLAILAMDPDKYSRGTLIKCAVISAAIKTRYRGGSRGGVLWVQTNPPRRHRIFVEAIVVGRGLNLVGFGLLRRKGHQIFFGKKTNPPSGESWIRHWAIYQPVKEQEQGPLHPCPHSAPDPVQSSSVYLWKKHRLQIK